MKFLWFNIQLADEHDGWGSYDKKNFYKWFGRLYCLKHNTKSSVVYNEFFNQNCISCSLCDKERYDSFVGPRDFGYSKLTSIVNVLKEFYGGK